MGEQNNMGPARAVLVTLAAFVLVLVLFYGLDHLIMNLQGLPLNADLTPAG